LIRLFLEPARIDDANQEMTEIFAVFSTFSAFSYPHGLRMTAQISDFTDTERWTIQTTVDERWSKDRVELHLADVEARLSPADAELTTCPAFFWHVGECNFVVMKSGEKRYRNQFFYQADEQFGTGIEEYSDLAECTLSLLQVQADYESERTKAYPGSNSSI
jgi:hypothetical protein